MLRGGANGGDTHQRQDRPQERSQDRNAGQLRQQDRLEQSAGQAQMATLIYDKILPRLIAAHLPDAGSVQPNGLQPRTLQHCANARQAPPITLDAADVADMALH